MKAYILINNNKATMEKQNNTALVDNCDNMYVTFEQAEMLAHILNYSEETDCAYDVKTKQLYRFSNKFNFNINKTWAGVHGWHYSLYSAPKKDDIILWLMDKIDFILYNKKN